MAGVTARPRKPDEWEARLRAFGAERSEESRAIRAGDKQVSEHAAIVARYADLFTLDQLQMLREAEAAEVGVDVRERLHRLAVSCEQGLVGAQLVELQDAYQTAELAVQVELEWETVPLRAARARLGGLDAYADREELGTKVGDASADLNEQRLELVRAGEALRAELSGETDPVLRSEREKGVSFRALADALAAVEARTADAYATLRAHWLDELLGAGRADVPTAYHALYAFRLSPLAHVFAKERATDVCLHTLRQLGLDIAAEPNIRMDLEERPQKAPRPAVIASDPPWVVHLITRAVGGLQDYQGLLHEAGHALHYAGCDPELPYAFRVLARDYALTEIYAFLCESVTWQPGWHSRYFQLSDAQASEHAGAVRFLASFMFRRYLAKLEYELEFWSRFSNDGGTPDGYAERLSGATGFAYRADAFLSDMDAGFYSADYLRAWIRSAQVRAHLREHVGDDWWRNPETGRFLRPLFREGTRPSSEEIAERLGRDPLDVEPFVAELAG